MKLSGLLVAFMLLATSATGLEPAVSGGNCPLGAGGTYHRATYFVEHRNQSGDAAWRITLHGESCVGSGGRITAFRWNKNKYVNPNTSNFWEWRGWTDTQNGGGVGQRHVFRRINAQFELCYLEVGCVRNAFPHVQMTMTNEWPWAEVSAGKGM